MISVAETATLILSKAPALDLERVPLASALHRVLREDIAADADSPRFDCSAMDGYALRSADDGGRLRITGEIPAGHDSGLEIGAGECARIFTGGRVPSGADRVVMQEDVEVEEGFIRIEGGSSGSHVRRQGENYRRGDVLARAGRRLRATELATLANCGVSLPLVTRQARVVHFATGDELIAPEQTPTGAQVRDCNSILISSLLVERDARLVLQQRLGDSLEAQQAALAGLDFDVALISGGASVGDYDFTRPVLKAAGFSIHVEKVNLRPGKPLVFATRGTQLAFGLPGNPVSHWVIFQLFLAPLFEKLSGCDAGSAWRRGRFRKDFAAAPNARETYWPAFAEFEEGEYRLQPLRFVSSGDIAGLAGANALVKITPNRERIGEAETVDFLSCEP